MELASATDELVPTVALSSLRAICQVNANCSLARHNAASVH
jgi:hypothetical protein